MRNIDEFPEFRKTDPTLPIRVRRTEERGPDNPINSMRNPPIIGLPNDCIADKEKILKGLEENFL
jgi:hypothetical protein